MFTIFIPEITTTVTVETNTNSLDEGINLINGSDVLSSCFGDIIEHLQAKKEELESLKDPLALAVSENLSSHQSQIISMKHKKTGMMMNSVDITHDGDGVYLVGNTVSSVDGFPYPLAIEQGTKAHWISPVTFHALHWVEGGQDRFSKGHMVSGIEADPYVEDSINMTESSVEGIVNEYINQLLGD